MDHGVDGRCGLALARASLIKRTPPTDAAARTNAKPTESGTARGGKIAFCENSPKPLVFRFFENPIRNTLLLSDIFAHEFHVAAGQTRFLLQQFFRS